VKMYAGPGGNRGVVTAWNPVERKAVWQVKEKFPVWSGTVVTAGDIVFYGTMDGWFKALNARDGSELWKFKVGSGIVGQPIVYRGPDGKEYVAVLSGVGGWAGAVVAGGLDVRDSSAALGFVNAMKDLPQATTKAGCCMCSRFRERRSVRFSVALRMTVLAVVGTAACQREERNFSGMPPSATSTMPAARESGLQPGPSVRSASINGPYEQNAYGVSQGKTLYNQFNCSGCHFQGGGGIGPR
jgi:hypothetical protein